MSAVIPLTATNVETLKEFICFENRFVERGNSQELFRYKKQIVQTLQPFKVHSKSINFIWKNQLQILP